MSRLFRWDSRLCVGMPVIEILFSIDLRLESGVDKIGCLYEKPKLGSGERLSDMKENLSGVIALFLITGIGIVELDVR